MIWGIYRNKITAIIITFILLVFSYVLLFYNAEQLSNQSSWISHSYSVISKLESLSSENKELEYDYNGYVDSRQDIFLKRFTGSVKKIDSVKKELNVSISDNPAQITNFVRLDTLFDEKTNRLHTGLLLVKDNVKDLPQAVKDSLMQTFYLGDYVGKIRSHINLMQGVERDLLKTRLDKMFRFSKLIKLINLISLLIALSFAFAAFFVYKKEYHIRKKVSEESDAYKNQLEKRVEELAVANKEINDLKNLEKFASTGRIARTIAHEVRNPLTNINLATDQLKDIPENDIEEKEMLLGMISRNSLRINQLISNLLNATKFTELLQEEESVNDIVDDALVLAKDRIELKKIRLIKDYSSDICTIKVDKEKIKIAFLNIIVNAIEAIDGKENGIINIKTFQLEQKCHVIFEDNGSGMDEEILGKLFEPYFTGKENGNGLGLTNTQNIILSHKGKLSVSSVVGKGSIFEVILDI